MDTITILFSIVIACMVVAFLYYYFAQGPTSSTTKTIQGSIADGRRSFNSNQTLPVSYDQSQGLTFSYTCWIKIDDFVYRYGQQKIIFTKGPSDLSSSCPALLVDANTNSLLVKIDTYGSTETIPISNIPAKKWIHVGIAVNQDAVDIYINGVLYIHHSLAQLPRQNSDTVHTGVGGGFDGKIALLEYHPSFLGPSDMLASMQTSPSPSHEDKGIGPLPPYFDISWWTKRS